jgi:hypothetical protein
LIWFDLIWFDLIWFDFIWFNLIWFDLNPRLHASFIQSKPQVLKLSFLNRVNSGQNGSFPHMVSNSQKQSRFACKLCNFLFLKTKIMSFLIVHYIQKQEKNILIRGTLHMWTFWDLGLTAIFVNCQRTCSLLWRHV